MPHATTIAGRSPEELGKELADLRYDALATVLASLGVALGYDSESDAKRGRNLLAERLKGASFLARAASIGMQDIWRICAQDEDESLKDEKAAKEADARKTLEVLSRYFEQPVRPVREYCDAILDWFSAIERANTDELLLKNGCHQGSSYYQHLSKIRIDMQKSNFLYRRIYLGEAKRTEICPMHKGAWNGNVALATGCPYGCAGTGWLHKDNEAEGWVSAQIVWKVPPPDGRILHDVRTYKSRWERPENGMLHVPEDLTWTWPVEEWMTLQLHHHGFGHTSAGVKFVSNSAIKELLDCGNQFDILT